MPEKHGAYANGKGMPGRTLVDGEWKQTGTWAEPNRRPTRNPHPTVKPLALTRYLATLLLPPERGTPRRILTPFSGVGSEMIGALQAGWDHATGIEIDPEYVTIAHARIRHHARERSAPLFGGTP